MPFMLKSIRLLRGCVLCALLCLCTPHLFAADALVKTLPLPDTSKLKPEQVKELTDARGAFEKSRVNLIGDSLAAAYALMGAAYARNGFDDVAAIAFYDASQLAPKDGRWMYLRGVIANAQKLPADARADFQAALALDQDYLPIRYRLADTLMDMGDADAARKLLLDALPQHPDQPTLFAMLGRIELKQKRYGEAIEHLQSALKLEPQANALYKDLADAYSGQGNTELADEAKAKIGTAPPTIDDPLVAGMYSRGLQLSGTPLQQAEELLAMHRFAAARAKVEEEVKTNANDVDAIAFAARLDALMGKSGVARDEAARAIKLKPDSASANLSQGMVYEFGGDDANAYAFYQRAVHADPKLADARLLFGNALMRRGDFAQAVEQYRQLAAIDPHAESIDSRLAAAQVAAGRCGDALTQVNAELAKRPQDGDLMQVFVRLASTCPAASAQERSMALDYGMTLYKQRPNASDTTALALAQAANGKFDDAQKSQAEAIYEAVRLGDTTRAQMYRETMRDFVAKRVPARPWPSNHPWFKPPLMSTLPQPPQAASPAAKPAH